MEIHSVLPEERARTEKGDYLPWGYRYADSTRNPRVPEESGPFGRNRSLRYTSGRRASTRQGTTPVRQKENTAVAEFGRLLAKDQAKEDERRNLPASGAASTTQQQDPPRVEPEAVPTECLLYGYASKASEWKVISKFERIVAPSIICEDYPREDPNLYLNSASPMGLSRSAIVVHRNLSKEALRKSRVYLGGEHWIKITFDSYQAAERACFFSPVEIDGYLVHCEMWSGKGPVSDVALPKGSNAASLVPGSTGTSKVARTLGPAAGTASAVAGFEKAMTLPRSHTMPDAQYRQPGAFPGTQDDTSVTSTTASSATAHDAHDQSLLPNDNSNIPAGLRSRSTPLLPSQVTEDPSSQYMTHIPSVRRVVLRPVSEALPPQPNLAERVLRSIPVVSWLFSLVSSSSGSSAPEKPSSTAIAEGPVLKEDGTWDGERNGWYWSFWWGIDKMLGTDFCGLKED